MVLKEVIVLVFVISLMNCFFSYLGFKAGKALKIIEIAQNESINVIEEEPGVVKEALSYLKKKDFVNPTESYKEESAYAVSPEEELKIDRYLKDIRDGKAQTTYKPF